MSYSRFNSEDLVLSSEKIYTPVWSSNSESLAKGDAELIPVTGDFYVDVKIGDETQFSITYGNVSGSHGGPEYVSGSGKTQSSTIYGQYRSLVLGDEEGSFKFDGENPSDDFIAITVNRARFKEKLRTSKFELDVKDKDSVDVKLVIKPEKVNRYSDVGVVYDLETREGVGGYGWFLPNVGIILLNPAKLIGLAGEEKIPNVVTAFWNDNFVNLTLQSEETVTSNYVFVRAKNSEFNYSMNPSNITLTGEIKEPALVASPETYITTVGLYNDANELLAVAKLSRPLAKNFNKEALIRIKLDY